MKLVLTERYRNELRREFQFIRERNPAAAVDVRRRIVETVRRLRTFPLSGSAWRSEGTRELVVPGTPYIVIYEIEADRVLVLMLFHTSRELPARTH